MATPTQLPPQSSTPSGGGSLSRWLLPLLALCLGGFLGVFVVAFGLSQANASLWSRIWSSLRGATQVDVAQPTVVNRIQALQRLETVVYTMDKIVTGEHSSAYLPDFLAADRLLLLVHGEVLAGIDFSGLKSGNVKVDGKRVRLRLPDAQVFTTRLDSARTRVYSRQTGWLVPTDPNLETEVRQEAERQLHDAAVADGVLKTAQQNARTTLTGMLQGLGFTEVEFE
jgi:Protein of unknown function (DUF4230)